MDATCSGCGKTLIESDILYTADARVVCAACNDKDDVAATDKRAANNIRTSAITSLLVGLLSVFVNPIYACTVIAISAGAYALKSLLPGNERFSDLLSPGTKSLIWVCACLGIAAAAFRLLIDFAILKIVLFSR